MRLRPVLGIAWRDALDSLRDPMALFWLVAFPVILMVLSATIWFNQPEAVTVRVGMVVNDTGPAVTWLMKAMEEAKVDGKSVFELVNYTSLSDALNDCVKGGLHAAIYVPPGFSSNLTMGSAVLDAYIAARSPMQEQVIRGSLLGFLEGFSRVVAAYKLNYSLPYIRMYVPENYTEFVERWMRGLAFPVNVTVEEVAPETLRTKEDWLGWAVVGLIGVEALFSGLITGSMMIVEEREKGTLHRLISSPISKWDLLLGKTLSTLVAVGISSLAILATGLAFGARIHWSPLNIAHWLAILCLVLATVMLIGAGLVLSIFAKSTKAASGISMGIAFPAMFTTGVWWPPKEWLPEPFKTVAYHSPLTMAIDAARDTIALGRGLEAVLPGLPWVIIGAMTSYVVGAIAYEVALRRNLMV